MAVPTIQFLFEVEKTFSVSYPQVFKEFCSKYVDTNIVEIFPNLSKGQFITDLETLISINTKIGNEQWSDYEKAIAGKVHPKDGCKFWGDLLPIYYIDGDIYGFNFNEPDDIGIYVWSVHCIVHTYSDLYTWLKDL